MRAFLLVGLVSAAVCLCAQPASVAAENWLNDPASSRRTQDDALRRIPFAKINPAAAQSIREIVERPSFFRRMPAQSIECDPELFTFLVRYPEVLVNIWDLMGITKVTVKRATPYIFNGEDGAGTSCKCDLVYGTPNVHVYQGTGSYKGQMAPREITGRCVCVLHSQHQEGADRGSNQVSTVMDVYIKLDNLGADLITRTLGPFVGKTADYNFVESSKFVGQISDVCHHNPLAAQHLAAQLDKVDPPVRQRFAEIAATIAAKSSNAIDAHQIRSPQLPVALRSHPPTSAPNQQTAQPLNGLSSSRLRISDEGQSQSQTVPSQIPGRVVPRKAQIYMRH